MLADFHLHTEFSWDCDAPIRRQVEQAIALGIEEICITDHYDYGAMPDDPNISYYMDLSQYLPAVHAIQEEYQDRIHVRTGIELGLQLRVLPHLADVANRYHFDFIIGSNHYIDGQDPYFPSFFEGQDERKAYEHYFEVTLERLRRMSFFDCIGHMDYIVRYGPNKNQFYSYISYQDYIDPILHTLIEKGIGLECNSGGLKYGLGHPNPTEDILRRYRELGGEIITVGSDAHDPRYVGYQFQRIRQILLDCGFRYYAVFRDRKPCFLPLEP